MDEIISGFEHITNTIIKEWVEKKRCIPSKKEVSDELIRLSPGFARDKIFAELFPTIYEIKRIEMEIQINNEKK